MDNLWDIEMADDFDQVASSLLLSSSDDETPDRTHGGSTPATAPNVARGQHESAVRLYHDYFSNYPVYSFSRFMRRYRLARPVFKRVIEALEVHDPYFTQREDCTGQLGFTSLQKATAALRILAYGFAADSLDEYVRMWESTALLSLEHFCEGVVACFGEIYMRAPTEEDLRLLLKRSADKGFPGMIGSMDCSKWLWKNCPTAYHGQYQGKEGTPAVTVEAIADERLWIWHCFFRMPGCANDINVLEASPLLNKLAEQSYPPPIEYTVERTKRHIPYWLADWIYPRFPFFLQTFSEPVTKKEKLFATLQEARRKDVERAFVALKGRWHILERPSRFWYSRTMKHVMNCCVILHNMMIEYGIDNTDDDDAVSYGHTDTIIGENASPMWANDGEEEATLPPPGSIGALSALSRFNRNEAEHFKTRELVIEHLWALHGST